MTSLRPLAIASLAAITLAGTAQAAAPNGSAEGKQASQCLVLYRLAGSAPGNAAHKADFDKLQALMGSVMDANKVSQAQFGEWSDAFMKQMGTPQKPNAAFLDASIKGCNDFAKAKLQVNPGKPAPKKS